MNSEETAAASFTLAHRRKSISGVRKNPPPVPVTPDRNPMHPPEAIPVKSVGLEIIGRILLAAKQTPCGEPENEAEKDFQEMREQGHPSTDDYSSATTKITAASGMKGSVMVHGKRLARPVIGAGA